MGIVKRLRSFLKKHLTKGGDYNFVSMAGGKFKIEEKERKPFFNLLNRAYTKIKDSIPLVFRPKQVGPFYLDVDFRQSENVKIPDSVFVDLSHENSRNPSRDLFFE